MTAERMRGFLKRSIASVLVVLLVVPFISIPAVAQESETEYVMRVYTNVDAVRDEWDIFALDTLRTKEGWFAEVNGLAELAACTVGKQKTNVVFTREETGKVIYKTETASVVKYNDQLYLPLETSTENLGIHFYNFRGGIAAECLRLPEELKSELTRIFFDEKYPLSRMIVELGDKWDAIEMTSELYAILPFVGDSNVVSSLLGADAKKRYEEAFGEILATEGTLAGVFLEIAEKYGACCDVMDAADLMLLLVKENGKLAEVLASSGLTEKSLSELIGDISNGEFDVWRTEIDKVSDATNFDGLLKTVRTFDIAQDAEESFVTAMQMVYDNGNNPAAQKAANKIYKAKFGTEAENAISFNFGWAEDTFVDFLSDRIDKAITGEGIASLSTAVVTTAIDYGTGASDKSNAVIFYALYASIQEDLKKAYFDLRFDGSNDIYAMRALALMYLKAGIAAFETMSFDKDLKEALENAKGMYADEIEKVLRYSEMEIQPDYDNRCCVDWLEENYLKPQAPTYLIDYVGMTLKELSSIWGDDYTWDEGWFLGGLKGLYYDDLRVSAVFFFYDPMNTGNIKESDVITAVDTGSGDYFVAEGIPSKVSYQEIKNLLPEGEIGEWPDSGADSYNVVLDKNVVVTFGWENGINSGRSSWVLIVGGNSTLVGGEDAEEEIDPSREQQSKQLVSFDDAMKKAQEYWDFTPGETAPETGFEIVMSTYEEKTVEDGREYYRFYLSWLVENEFGEPTHASVIDAVLVDIETGECLPGY